MTLSGHFVPVSWVAPTKVLIPLLVDDPLWVKIENAGITCGVLIPLLVDDPLWAYH